jgi:hypothetical protein
MDFDVFWKAYPQRVGKFTARSAWDKALKHAKPEDIIAGAQRYAIWLAQPGWRPRPKHPSTWLNGGCWLDELEETRNGGNSVIAAFDRLEQRLTREDDNPPRSADILRLPKR